MSLTQSVHAHLLRRHPDTAHKLGLASAQLYGLFGPPPAQPSPALRTMLAGLVMPNPLMVAAGLLKNGEAIRGFQKLGFGGVEVGTVVPFARRGNIHLGETIIRLPGGSGVINWKGLPSQGYKAALQRLKRYRGFYGNSFTVGVNLMPNPDETDIPTKWKQLYQMAKAFAPYASYITLNISCPNTHNLTNVVSGLADDLKALHDGAPLLPIALKIGPADSERTVWQLMDVGVKNRIDWVVFFNTFPPTLKNLLNAHHLPSQWLTNAGAEVGGYSGQGGRDYTLAMLALSGKLFPKLPVVATGAQNGLDAIRLMAAGAAALQTNTGLVLKGPALVGQVNNALLEVGGMGRFQK